MSSYAFAWYRDKGRLDLEHVTEHIVQMALKLVRKQETTALKRASG
jgi:hypothetical protein